MRLAGLEVADVGAANVSRNGRARMDPLRRRNDLRDVLLVWMDMVVGVRYKFLITTRFMRLCYRVSYKFHSINDIIYRMRKRF